MIRFPKMHSKKLQKKNNVAYLMAGGEKKLLLNMQQIGDTCQLEDMVKNTFFLPSD